MRGVNAAFLTVLAILMAENPMVAAGGQQSLKLTDAAVENIMRRSYRYVAAYDAINKTAEKVGGWNKLFANKELLDHTVRMVARPNNDTFHVVAMPDLRKEPMILEMPAIDSDYVSLMVSAYDHYVSIPLSTRVGDFREPTRMLFYTARTEGYDGAAVYGVDRIFETTGDFVEAAIRVMPHANDRPRFATVSGQIDRIRLLTLSEYGGGESRQIADVGFPSYGGTDLEALLAVSVIGSIGLPPKEAVHPQVPAADGKQLNAKYDYVVRMSAEELPPAKAFWSLALHDLDNGFFIRNERRKYSVGQNAGMKLDENGGIEIHIAAKKPEGDPEENWLPITHRELNLSLQFRIYVPDLERYETWKMPVAERVSTN